VLEDGATYDVAKALDMKLRQKGREEHHDPHELELVGKMYRSRPSKVRYSGGMFNGGDLAFQTVAGNHRYFESSGRIKRCYVDMVKATTLTQTPTRRIPKRTCNLPVPASYMNPNWDRAPAGESYIDIPMNLWTPSKYTNWQEMALAKGQRPTSIPQGIRQCIFCNYDDEKRPACHCLLKRVSPAKPRICPTGDGMGEGVRATRTYEKGELLGELVGDIAPLGQFSDGWAAVLERDDLPGLAGEMTAWCLIHPRYTGNWVRKVNHSCQPNCLFESMPISGNWRVMLKAIKRVDEGSWILVSYGDEYWQSPGCRCICGSENCIGGPRSNGGSP
jgi:hypothetical protein